MAARTFCGVLVTDGPHVLLGYATRTPRWDVPKGLADPGEALAAAAARELREEMGLLAEPDALVPLGIHACLHGKELALFAWRAPAMPDPTTLHCASMVSRPGQGPVPRAGPLRRPAVERGAGACGPQYGARAGIGAPPAGAVISVTSTTSGGWTTGRP